MTDSFIWIILLKSSAVPNKHTNCPHLFHLYQFPARVFIVPQVLFIAHQDDGNIGTEMFYFWCPLLWNIFCEGQEHNLNESIQTTLLFFSLKVFCYFILFFIECYAKMNLCVCSVKFSHTQAIWTVYRKAHENNICVWIWQWPQPVIVFLTSCVP